MQILVNKFIVECPQLSDLIDEDALIAKFIDKTKNLESHSDDTAFTTNKMESLKMTDYGVDCVRIEADEPLVAPLFKKLNYDMFWEDPFGWFIHKYNVEMQTKVHTDQKRNAVLIYPIVPKAYTIVYVDPVDKHTEIYRHTYRCPTIINASIPHYIEDGNLEKIHFQISLFVNSTDWSTVVNENI